MRKLIKNNKGMTLVEISIYIAIFAIVGILMIGILAQLIQMKAQAEAESIISDEASNFFEKLLYDIRNCDSFTVVDANNLTVVTDAVTSGYALSNGQIEITSGTTEKVTSRYIAVTDLTFADWTTPNSESLLHVEINLQKGNYNEKFQTSIKKR